jgi:hypothetical protein
MQGSERLQLLVSDCPGQWKTLAEKKKETSAGKDGESALAPWVMVAWHPTLLAFCGIFSSLFKRGC